jgi:hypothetical protein
MPMWATPIRSARRAASSHHEASVAAWSPVMFG